MTLLAIIWLTLGLIGSLIMGADMWQRVGRFGKRSRWTIFWFCAWLVCFGPLTLSAAYGIKRKE